MVFLKSVMMNSSVITLSRLHLYPFIHSLWIHRPRSVSILTLRSDVWSSWQLLVSEWNTEICRSLRLYQIYSSTSCFKFINPGSTFSLPRFTKHGLNRNPLNICLYISEEIYNCTNRVTPIRFKQTRDAAGNFTYRNTLNPAPIRYLSSQSDFIKKRLWLVQS